MKPSLPSRAEFRDSLRSVFETDFQTKVLEYLHYLYPSAQRVALKQGDGQMDIIQVNEGRVFACYAPIRYNDGWKEADVISKIKEDLEGVKKTLPTALKEWVFIHNFPASALTNKIAAFMMEQRAANPDIKLFEPWGIDQLWQHLIDPNPEQRRTLYLRSLAAAFTRYEELALTHYETAEDKAPSILDIFVHPACSQEHLRPEDIDADEQARLANPDGFEPKHRTQDLIQLLAQPDRRRTVLLADPGMGKSTLIQSLIAHLASGQPVEGAPALTGLLPVPLILRDLVPLLDHSDSNDWTWDHLIDVLITQYRPGENAPLLLDGYRDHPQEFKDYIKTNAGVFYLIDGLDEIGDLNKRKQIVRAIQEGIRTANVEARWLITSRVIGYEDAPVHYVVEQVGILIPSDMPDEERVRDGNLHAKTGQERIRLDWSGFVMQTERAPVPPEHSWIHVPEDLSVEPARRTTDRQTGTSDVRHTLVIVSSCEIAYCVNLAPFDNRRQDVFTQRWFQHRHSKDYSSELMREIRRSAHDGVRIIGRVPNLLCMMNMLKRSGKPLPDGRFALYEEITKAYLGTIDAAYHLSKLHGHDCPFTPEQRKRLLTLVAIQMQSYRVGRVPGSEEDRVFGPVFEPDSGNIVLSRIALAQFLEPFVASMQTRQEVADDRSPADLITELFDHIAKRSGLLIPRGTDREGRELFAFTHLSFLEFFAACYLIQELRHHDNFEDARRRAERRGGSLDEADYLRRYPRGPVEIGPSSLERFASHPLWQEVLVFLMEAHSHRDDHPQRDALLEYLFPALYRENASAPQTSQVAASLRDAPLAFDSNVEDCDAEESASRSDDATLVEPLMPVASVELLVKLAWDKDLGIPEGLRREWWLRLWKCRLFCRKEEWRSAPDEAWHIAPILLRHEENQIEVMQSLADAIRGITTNDTLPLDRLICLANCPSLRSVGLQCISDVKSITAVDLSNCTALEDTKAMSGWKNLWHLDLEGCTGLTGSDCLQGLAGLERLEMLTLSQCRNVQSIAPLASLHNLQKLDLVCCTGLKDPDAFEPLSHLRNLRALSLEECTGLASTASLSGLTNLAYLDLTRCDRLDGEPSLLGLMGLQSLKEVNLDGCGGLATDDVLWLEERLGKDCKVTGH